MTIPNDPLCPAVPAEEISIRTEAGCVWITIMGKWVMGREIPTAPQSPKDIAIWADVFAQMAKLSCRANGIELGVDPFDLAVRICSVALDERAARDLAEGLT